MEYENYVSFIDDEFSDEYEDPQFLEAIEASLAEVGEQTHNTPINETDSVKSLLTLFQTNNLDLNESATNANITISRKAVFSSHAWHFFSKNVQFAKVRHSYCPAVIE